MDLGEDGGGQAGKGMVLIGGYLTCLVLCTANQQVELHIILLSSFFM